jgi:hypothetical protein
MYRSECINNDAELQMGVTLREMMIVERFTESAATATLCSWMVGMIDTRLRSGAA